MPSRKEILEQATKIVVGEREEIYGDPEDSFTTIARFWEVYLNASEERVIDIGTEVDEVPYLPAETKVTLRPEDVAIMMMLLKIARLVKAPDHVDSWVDIAGYAACGGQIASSKSK